MTRTAAYGFRYLSRVSSAFLSVSLYAVALIATFMLYMLPDRACMYRWMHSLLLYRCCSPFSAGLSPRSTSTLLSSGTSCSSAPHPLQ
jgi:hypothetical protein